MKSGWRERNLNRLMAMSAGRTAVVTAVSVATVAVLDWLSRAEIAASLAYLLPVSLAAWGLGRIWAAATALVCAGLWFGIDLALHPDGVEYSLEVVNLIVLTVAFQLFGLLLATLREELDHARRLASTDPLTSVHNRRAFWSAVAREVARGRRHGTPFSLAYIDVDGFKSVNDSYGHGAGDALLRRIALALQEDLRELDMVARLGGDEFALLLPGTDDAGAGKVITRLRKRLARAAWRQPFDIDFSIGVLTVLSAPDNVARLIARADQLMYQVKRSGRGLVLFDVLRSGDDLPPTDVDQGRPPSMRMAK